MSSTKSDNLFKNRLLNALTRTHIAVPLVLFYGMAAGLVGVSLYYGFIAPWANLWMFLAGLFIWTLVEYLVHRYAFHAHTETERATKIKYAFHGLHHDFPKDKKRLAMPPILSVVLASSLFGFYYLLMGYYGLPFAAGFVSGYASYLVVHYTVHAWRPPNNFLKALWVHHSIHHYQDHTRAFGVSTPLWDLILGTMPIKNAPKKMVVDSENEH